jgi:hypothetical protein
MNPAEIIEIGYSFLPNVALERGPYHYIKLRFPASESNIVAGNKLKLNLSSQSSSDAMFLASLSKTTVTASEVCGMYIVFDSMPGMPTRKFQMRVWGDLHVIGFATVD